MKRNKYEYRKLAFETSWLKKQCEKCWQTRWIIDIHHKDKNHWNNEKDNLQILCHSCHAKLHTAWEKHPMYWKKHSQKTKLKMSINNWMKWKFWKDHHSSKKINQYILNWEFIKTWDSTRDIERELWINHSSISRCCKLKVKTAWWYTWKYV